jgi:hypothetical protein
MKARLSQRIKGLVTKVKQKEAALRADMNFYEDPHMQYIINDILDDLENTEVFLTLSSDEIGLASEIHCKFSAALDKTESRINELSLKNPASTTNT